MASIMAGIADVALCVVGFVRVEVLEGLCSTLGERSVVTMTRVPAIIDVAVEAVRAMEPGTGPNKNSAGKPVRPIVAVRSAVIRRIVEVSIWAYRRRSNVDGNLSGCHRHAAHQRNSESRENERFPPIHNFFKTSGLSLTEDRGVCLNAGTILNNEIPAW